MTSLRVRQRPRIKRPGDKAARNRSIYLCLLAGRAVRRAQSCRVLCSCAAESSRSFDWPMPVTRHRSLLPVLLLPSTNSQSLLLALLKLCWTFSCQVILHRVHLVSSIRACLPSLASREPLEALISGAGIPNLRRHSRLPFSFRPGPT